MARIIAVSSQKGGVCKTTITTNLGAILAKKGHKVLLVDTDTQANTSVSFGINPDDLTTTIYDVLIDGLPPEYPIIKPLDELHILPSNEDFSFFEFDVLTNLNKYPNPFYLLRDNLKPLEKAYDYILIDTPPNLGLVQGNVLSYAQEVIIPFQPEPFAMRSLIKILKSIQDFKEQHNPTLEVLGVLGVMIDARTGVHAQILQKCRQYCHENNIRMFDIVIPRTIKYAKAIAYMGLPAVLAEKDEEVRAYYELEGEIRKWHENVKP